jgi:hypothetical protein
MKGHAFGLESEEDVVTNYLDDIIQIDEWVMVFLKDITPLTRVSEIDR